MFARRYSQGVALIRLSDAVDCYRRERGAYGNGYDWYRKEAHRRGSVSIGGHSVKVEKVAGAWYLDDEDLAEALATHRQRTADQASATNDYKYRILRGSNGQQVSTDWGYYVVRVPFHLTTNTSVPPWKGSGQAWISNQCWKPADSEHNRPRCQSCEDWSGCGRDCTLSRVFCTTCGSSCDV
jgi:hypothetical protein